MATNLQAGSVAVKIDVDQRQFNAAFVNMQNIFNQFNNDMRSYSHSITDSFNTVTPGFTGFAAFLRDASVTAAALGHVLRRSFQFIGGLVTDFSAFGDQVSKLSQKTGISANDLSLLGFAAEQSGTSLDTLGNGFKSLQKNIAAAFDGKKTNLDIFRNLGIDFQKFNKISKTNQFRAIAEQISKIKDETKQADIAMKLFGGDGTALLPLLQKGANGIDGLMTQGDKLGIGISEADAKNAEELTNAINRLKRAFTGLKNEIVSKFANSLSVVLDNITQLVNSLKAFGKTLPTVMNNLGTAIQKVTADTSKMNAGFAMLPLVLTTTPIAATSAWKGLAMVLSPFANVFKYMLGFIKPVLTFVVSFATPLGLLRTAIAAAASAFLYFSGTGSQVMGVFGKIGGTIKNGFMSAFGDVVALIQKGDIAGATQLQWLKIQLIFEQGKLKIVNTFSEIVASITEPFALLYDSVMSAVTPLWDGIVAGWQYVTAAVGTGIGWLTSLFGEAWTQIKDGWTALTSDLGETIVGGWWMIATGINEALSWVQKSFANVVTWIETTFLGVIREIVKAVGSLISYVTGFDAPKLLKDIEANLNVAINNTNAGNANYQAGVDARKQAWQSSIDTQASNSLDRVAAAKANAPQTNDRIEELKKAIADLRNPKPDTKTEKVANEIADVLGTMKSPTSYTAGSGSTGKAGTFNAFEIGSVMGNTIEDTVKAQLKAAIQGNNILTRIAVELENSGEFA